MVPGLQGDALWDGGAGTVDEGNQKAPPFCQNTNIFLQEHKPGVDGALLSLMPSPTCEHISERPDKAGEAPSA